MYVAPSILSLDYSKFKEQLDTINEKCHYIHFDVMDGHFVPNLSFGPDIFKAFRKNSNLFMDVHLMVSDPSYFSDVFIKAGADGITFHDEALGTLEDKMALINKIHNNYCKAGVSIKPKTDVEAIIPLLESVDLVLVMSVEPGYGGQAFIDSAYDKIRQLDEYRKKHNLNYLIEVDGGVNDKNAHKLKDYGCDIIVVGSHLFKDNLEKNIDDLNVYE